MRRAVIPIRYTYAEQGDIVLRKYIRALKKAKLKGLMRFDDDFAYVVGEVDEEGRFIEFFTRREIPYACYMPANKNVVDYIAKITTKEKELLTMIMRWALFNERVYLDFEPSTLEERDSDITEEARAYNLGHSAINPYEGDVTDYNNFLVKVKKACIRSGSANRENLINEINYHTMAAFLHTSSVSLASQIDPEDQEIAQFLESIKGNKK